MMRNRDFDRHPRGPQRLLAVLALLLTAIGMAAVHAQVAPECVPAVRALQAGDNDAGGAGLDVCVDAGFGVERAMARVLQAEFRARQGDLDGAFLALDEIEAMGPALAEIEPDELASGHISISAPGYLRRSARSPAPVLAQANHMRVILLLERRQPLAAAQLVRDLMDGEWSLVQEESIARIGREELALVQMAAALQQRGDYATCARFMREISLDNHGKRPLAGSQINAFSVLYASCHERADAIDAGIAHYEGLFPAARGRELVSLPSTDAKQRHLLTAMLVAEARLRMLQRDFGERTRYILDQAVAAADTDAPETRYLRAYLRLQTGDAAAALGDAVRAEELVPGHPAHRQFAELVRQIEDRL
jgi:hypothetical protein